MYFDRLYFDSQHFQYSHIYFFFPIYFLNRFFFGNSLSKKNTKDLLLPLRFRYFDEVFVSIWQQHSKNCLNLSKVEAMVISFL